MKIKQPKRLSARDIAAALSGHKKANYVFLYNHPDRDEDIEAFRGDGVKLSSLVAQLGMSKDGRQVLKVAIAMALSEDPTLFTDSMKLLEAFRESAEHSDNPSHSLPLK